MVTINTKHHQAGSSPSTATTSWLDALPDLPLVYVTLGTIYNRDLDVFRTVIEGLRDSPCWWS